MCVWMKCIFFFQKSFSTKICSINGKTAIRIVNGELIGYKSTKFDKTYVTMHFNVNYLYSLRIVVECWSLLKIVHRLIVDGYYLIE